MMGSGALISILGFSPFYLLHILEFHLKISSEEKALKKNFDFETAILKSCDSEIWSFIRQNFIQGLLYARLSCYGEAETDKVPGPLELTACLLSLPAL